MFIFLHKLNNFFSSHYYLYIYVCVRKMQYNQELSYNNIKKYQIKIVEKKDYQNYVENKRLDKLYSVILLFFYQLLSGYMHTYIVIVQGRK